MNKRIFCGLAFFGLITGAFIACGSGEVSKASVEDNTKVAIADGEYANLIDTALAACATDPSCMQAAVTPSSAVVSSSSEIVVEPGKSSMLAQSSSSKLVTSSSSTFINLSSIAASSSSGVILTSSSSIVSNGTVNGTCAPVPATISKTQTTSWTFTRLTPSGIAGISAQNAASFEWTMPNSTEASASGTGLSKTSATYATSGSFGATLVVDGNTIKCADLQVNGSPITGCSCKAASSTVDVATNEVATWTVSNCASAGATITGYTWSAGVTGNETSATANLAAKGDSISPVVSVSNDDNTVQEFKCETVTAINSSDPDYLLESTSEKIVLPAGSSTVVMNLPSGWNNSSDGLCTFACNGTGDLSVTIDGKTSTSSYYLATKIPIASTVNNYSLKVELNTEMTCSVGW